MIYYVDANALTGGNGSKEAPFHTISDAAFIAKPGDEVVVAPGIYREHVIPRNKGEENARIVYRSEVPLGAVITGAEVVKGWNVLIRTWTSGLCRNRLRRIVLVVGKTIATIVV